MLAYLALFTSILLSTVGDFFLKKSEGFRIKKYALFTIVVYIPVFYLLSIVMLEIAVGITYATWSGIGVLLTTLLGVLVFKEEMNLKIVSALVVVIAGVLILNLN